jgi:hypothetical protein
LQASGAVVAAHCGFIAELYVHMGHHPAWKYTQVLELIFDDGCVAALNDRSELMAQQQRRRDTITDGFARPRRMDRHHLLPQQPARCCDPRPWYIDMQKRRDNGTGYHR